MCSGADLASLVREATLEAIRQYIDSTNENDRDIENTPFVNASHFVAAIQKIIPSVSEKVFLFFLFV